MKKSKKFIIGIVLIVIGAIGLLGLFQEKENKFNLALGSLIFIGIGITLLVFDKKYPAQNKKEQGQIQPPNINTKKKEIPEGEMNYNLFEDIVDGNALCYKYEQNLYIVDDDAFDFIPGSGGKAITFKQEPSNPHDKNAVAVYLENKKIGYVYRGKIQDMINDFIKRGDLILGYLNKYSITEKTATYKIGFYSPLTKFDSRQFHLVKIHTKPTPDEHYSRAEALASCKVGDNLEVIYDDSEDIYKVSGFINFDILEVGELPPNASNFIKGEKYKQLPAILDEISIEEDNEYNIIKAEAMVTVYLVK